MPPLSRKAFAKPTNGVSKSFKTPLLTQENIRKIISNGEEEPRKKQLSSTPKSIEPKQQSPNPDTTSKTLSQEKSRKKSVKKTLSMHLSFEETESDNISDTSSRMNEPSVKKAYLQFVKSFHKDDSACSTQLMEEKSLDDIFPSQASTTSTSTLVDRHQQEQTPDSGLSLSQVLNQKDVKKTYLEHMGHFLEEEKFDFMKNFKPTKKKAKVCDSKKVRGEKEKDESKALTEEPEKARKTQERKRKLVEKARRPKDSKSKVRDEKTKNECKTIDNAQDPKVDKRVNQGKKIKKDVSQVRKNSAVTMSLYQKMLLIQESRNVGLYALCDLCDKARYLPHIKDPLDLPEKWYCSMNPDVEHNKCSDPEEIDENEREYLIDNKFNAGSIVWARMDGYPWWPAMVEDDPDYEEYCWLEEGSEEDILEPTMYHVTFFDSSEVTRAWIRTPCLKPFQINMTNPEFLPRKFDKFKLRVEAGFKQASNAIELPLIDRLKKYSFVQRYMKPLIEKKEIQSKNKRPIKKNDVLMTSKRVRNNLSSDNNVSNHGDDSISVILNGIDWQNDTDLNTSLLE